MSIDDDYKKMVSETKHKIELEAKLYQLLDDVNEQGKIEYRGDLKEVIDSLIEISPSAENLMLASQLYAHDFNEFDVALELARKAAKIEPSDETRKNYQEIYKIRKFAVEY